MKIPRIYSDSAGTSKIGSIELDFSKDQESTQRNGDGFPYGDPENPIPFSEPWPVTRMDFWRFPEDLQHSWRNPPCRVFLVILKGAVKVEVSGGEALVLKAGDLALFEDLEGEGHRIGPEGGEVTGVVLTLADSA